MAIEVRPATLFEDVQTVVGPKRPDATVCWCLSYRIPSKQNLELRGTARGDLVQELVRQDPPPGVLAYDGDDVVGWAAVHPRADTSFARNRRIPHVDDLAVWSVWCIRVRPGYRGKGISHHLLGVPSTWPAATAPRPSRATRWTTRAAKWTSPWPTWARAGLFERAGFVKAADTDSVLNGFPRVLMRLDLR